MINADVHWKCLDIPKGSSSTETLDWSLYRLENAYNSEAKLILFAVKLWIVAIYDTISDLNIASLKMNDSVLFLFVLFLS